MSSNSSARGRSDRVAVWWMSLGLVLAGVYGWGYSFVIGRRASRHTSLVTAWRWLLAAELAVLLMLVSDHVLQVWSGRTADYGWCVTSILLLCPPMAVLGARRPGVKVWSAFILLPMLLVLSWPVWTLVLQGSELRGLALESPTVIGFFVVLVMSGGNFLGTRFTPAACCWMLGTTILFLSVTGWSIVPDGLEALLRLVGVLLLELSILSTMIPARSRMNRHPVNRLWDDFRNSFGIVWGLRMVERINALATQEHWTIRMQFSGFPEGGKGRLTSEETPVTDASRWLFRRFVDEQWVNDRLNDLCTSEFQSPSK